MLGRVTESGSPAFETATTATSAPRVSVWSPERRALTVGLIATITLLAFEALGIGTVMPLVAADLGDLRLYGWAFSGFFLGNLVGIVAAGIAIDRSGVRRPFVIGLLLFAVGLLIGGAATSMPMLVLGRVVQGAGAGVIPPVAYVTIREWYPERIRPTMFALLSTAWVVPGLVGPAISGWIGDHLTWRLVFLGLLPLILVSGGLTLLALRGATDRAGSVRDRRADAVAMGLVLLVAAGTGLVLLTPTAGEPPVALALGAIGVAIALPALVRLLPTGTLTARPGLPATILLRGVVTFAFFGASAYLPLALIDVRGTSATEAGLVLTGATLSWTAGSWIQSHRMPTWGAARLIRLGMLFVLVGTATTAAVLVPGVPVAVAMVTWAVTGLGMGLTYSSISLLVLRDAPEGEAGNATAAMQLSDVVGTVLGTGLGSALVAIAIGAGSTVGVGIGLAFGVSVVAALGGLALGRRLR
jgi:MFS family permease